jgi:hypothetical protein
VTYISVRHDEAWFKDTSYAGASGAPTGLVITTPNNNYSVVNIAWTAPSGGAPAAFYHVEQLNNAGGIINQWDTPNTFFNNMGVNWDTQYFFRVWSASASSVLSGGYAEVRYQIGHPLQTGSHLVTGLTRPWSASVTVDRAYKNQSVGVNVPSRVSLDHLQINLHVNASTTTFVSSSRNGVFIVAGAVYGPWQQSPWQPNPWSENKAWGQTTPGLAGVQAQGTGWASSQTSSSWTYSGTIGATGTETYDEYQPYTIATEQTNTYW